MKTHPQPCNTSMPDKSCSACYLWRHNPHVRAAWGGDPAQCEPEPVPVKSKPVNVVKPLRLPLPIRKECPWQGAIVSYCTSCNKATSEANHVRQCNHPSEHAPDTCTRNNANSELQRCSDCTLYPSTTEDERRVTFDAGAVEAIQSAAANPPKRKRPRVLFASQNLDRTGAPILLMNLVTALRHFDAVVHSPFDGPLAKLYAEKGIEVRRDLNLTGVDLVVVNTIVPTNVVVEAELAGVPCVWMIHESDPILCGDIIRSRMIAAIDSPARVVFPCQSTADVYAQWRAAGVDIVPSIIPAVPKRDRAESRKRLGVSDEFVILTMGMDEPRKGHDDIREAIKGMAGVKFYPVAGVDDPFSYYAAADLYICSSRVEAFPLALQEAKAYGLPVITTDVFGCADIIRRSSIENGASYDGFHYTPGDVDHLRHLITLVRSGYPGGYKHSPAQKAFIERRRGPLTHLPTFAESVEMYEAVFRAALGVTSDEQPIHVVYHVAGMGPYWKPIVTEQLTQLVAAGLTKVHATHVGDGEEWLIDEAARLGVELTLCEHQDDVRYFETPAMRLIERLARRGSKPILYLHSKGVSYDPASKGGRVYHEWRKLMMRELVAEWRDNLDALTRGGPDGESLDVIGVNWWKTRGSNHFSGNFWLASAEWLRALPKFETYYRDRYSCECWIGVVPGARVRSLVCTDKKFWSEDVSYLMELMK